MPVPWSLGMFRGDVMRVIHVFGATDVGLKRKRNEDATRYIHKVSKGHFGHYEFHALILADGMGGYQKGEIASNRVCDALSLFTAEAMGDIISSAGEKDGGVDSVMEGFSNGISRTIESVNDELFRQGDEETMGCTLVYVLQFNDHVFTAHIGDSRAYLISDAGLMQMTRDHSYVNALLDNDVITPDEALEHPMRNVITRSIGTKEKVEVEFGQHFLPRNSRVLLCSDGLSDLVTDKRILDIIHDVPSPRVCDALIAEANGNGGKDNISVLFLVSTSALSKEEKIKITVRRPLD